MFKKINDLLSGTVVLVIIIVLTIFVGLNTVIPTVNIIYENRELEREYEELEAQYSLTLEYLELINDPQIQQQLIRGQYQLSEDDEILFIFPDEVTAEETDDEDK